MNPKQERARVARLIYLSRRAVRMNQQKFCREMGIAQGTLSKIERGDLEPAWQVLLAAFHICNEAPSQSTAERLFNAWVPIIDLPRYRSSRKKESLRR